MSEERKRLTRGEQTDLVDLMAVTDKLAYVLNRASLTDRIKLIKRGRWRMAASKTNMLRLCEDILDTVPVEQLKHMKSNLKHVRCHTYIGNAVQNKDKLEGRWFNIGEMNTIASAIRECCISCSLDTQEQRQCPYKKLMDCLPVDPDESGSACGWFTRLGRE